MNTHDVSVVCFETFRTKEEQPIGLRQSLDTLRMRIVNPFEELGTEVDESHCLTLASLAIRPHPTTPQ